jgi:HlyD family secretion protein
MKMITFLMRKLSLYLAVAGIILGIYLVKTTSKEDPVPVHTAEPAVNPFEEAIAASGIVESLDRNLFIGTSTAGIIKALHVEVGDSVQKGDTLFQMDDRELEAELFVQKANLEVAEANLERLESQLERLTSIQDHRAISLEEIKTRQHDVAIANAQYRAAESVVKQSMMLIDRLTVKAPRQGMILQCNVREGEYLALDSTTSAILLGDLSRLQVRADIDEQNACRFYPNQTAFAYPKNHTTLKIPLTFQRIEPYVIPKRSLTGSSDERVDTRVLQVIYSFDPPKEFHLYVGQQLDVFIDTRKEETL